MPSFVRTSHLAFRGPRPLTLAWLLAVVLVFLLLLFIFAIRHHSKGHKDIWFSPVNALDWSNSDSKKKASNLPAPVTARRARSQSRPPATAALTAAPRRHVSEKRAPAPRRPSQSRQPQTAYMPDRREPRSRTTDRYRPDYYHRDASPRR